jgi:RimJ/RimL family protein N-acetyltransferase
MSGLTAEKIGAGPEVTTFLEKIVWGTEGARYTLTDLEPTLSHLPDPVYLALRYDDRLVGLRMILEKNAQFENQSVHCFYHSMFCVEPSEKGKGLGKRLAQETVHYLGSRLGSKGLIYCHVETDNLNSLRIAESLGYRHVGNFSVMSFSRFFPKPSSRMAPLADGQEAHVLEQLNTQYGSHALRDFPLSLRPESTYVLSDHGRLLAGLQADLQRWKIHSLAGAGGAVALHALPRIPLLRDLFNPLDFRFLKIGNVFFEKNHPEAVFELVQAVLAHHHLKTAMMFWDKESPVYQTIARTGRLGLLNALTETPVKIMALFQGFTDNEIADFYRRPKVISPCDI